MGLFSFFKRDKNAEVEKRIRETEREFRKLSKEEKKLLDAAAKSELEKFERAEGRRILRKLKF